MTHSYTQLVAILKAHKGATSDDIAPMFGDRSCFAFTQTTCDYGHALGVDWAMVFALPQKQIKRTAQLINALQIADYKNIDYTHARILIAMRLAGEFELTTDALTALAANKRSESVNTRGVNFSAVNALFARSHGVSTVRAKVSNSTGKNGIYQVLGVTWAIPGERNHSIALNPDSLVVKRFFALLDSATTSQLASMVPAEK